MAAMARAREFLLNFPSSTSQGFLALVGGGYVTYYFTKLSVFAVDGFFEEKKEKERRREQYIQEAVELRAAANNPRREGGTRRE